jgi:hypothetical protein
LEADHLPRVVQEPLEIVAVDIPIEILEELLYQRPGKGHLLLERVGSSDKNRLESTE